jgi:molybdenum cofactor sulfurtransferase
MQLDNSETNSDAFHMIALPAENNFSGVKIPLAVVKSLQQCTPKGRWKVVLDAAAFVCHSRLDLSEYPADFVTLSFYKMFGFPTGLGALIVRNGIF